MIDTDRLRRLAEHLTDPETGPSAEPGVPPGYAVQRIGNTEYFRAWRQTGHQTAELVADNVPAARAEAACHEHARAEAARQQPEATPPAGEAVEARESPCFGCQSTTAERSACPECERVLCQRCAEGTNLAGYVSCCDIPTVTDAELRVMEHSTAWPKLYRNHFCTNDSTTDWPTIQALITRGLMRQTRKPSELTGGDCVFGVTAEGIALLHVLRPTRARKSTGKGRT